MTEEEFDYILKEELAKDLLTEEQFNNVSAMNWPQAVKYIKSKTDLSLKMSKTYYDLNIK